jgi:hypothetical protein
LPDFSSGKGHGCSIFRKRTWMLYLQEKDMDDLEDMHPQGE